MYKGDSGDSHKRSGRGSGSSFATVRPSHLRSPRLGQISESAASSQSKRPSLNQVTSQPAAASWSSAHSRASSETQAQASSSRINDSPPSSRPSPLESREHAQLTPPQRPSRTARQPVPSSRGTSGASAQLTHYVRTYHSCYFPRAPYD
jgi:hypothetical protein